MAKLRISLAGFAALALAAGLGAQSQRRPRIETFGPAPFDYYVLSLSWAPAFCAHAADASNSPECAPGRHVGFIVHGLWPEVAAGRGPEACGIAKRLPKQIVDLALPDMLSAGLIQHEWATHGVCSGLNPFDYFSAIVQTRSAVQIPVQISSIENRLTEGPGQIEAQFSAANPTFPKTAFRTSCPRSTFQEERVCFDKNLKPAGCTAGVGECVSPAVAILPPL